jgi:hypothetical protein
MARQVQKGRKARNPLFGSSLDDFLREEGLYEEVLAQAAKAKLIRGSLTRKARTSMEETSHLLGNPANAARLRKALESEKAGHLIRRDPTRRRARP